MIDIHPLKEDRKWKMVILTEEKSGVNVGRDDRTTVNSVYISFMYFILIAYYTYS